MGLRGQLTKDKVGFSMPAHSPMFGPPPYDYRGATLLIFKYATDAETSAALVPDALELPDQATACLVFASYPQSSLGPYDEVVLYQDVLWQGQPFRYATHLYVTSDVAMAAGREMGGYPKAMAKIDFLPGSFYAARIERPAGLLLATGVLRPERQLPATFPIVLDYATLRVIPSPTRDAPAEVSELLRTRWTVTAGEVWTGTGSCSLTGASAIDPLHLVPVVKPLGCELIKGDIRVELNDRSQSTPF